MKATSIIEVPICDIRIEHQIREFSWGDIEELAKSIGALGWCAPILVSKVEGDPPYRLWAGERRLQACRDHLKWEKIPCQIVAEKEGWKLQIQENLNRSELHWIEIAGKLDQCTKDGASRASLAQLMGQTERHVIQLLSAYRGLAPENLAMLKKGRHRPPLASALAWAPWRDRPERQREEIDKWLGLRKKRDPKDPKLKSDRRKTVSAEKIRRLLGRAIAAKANRAAIAALRWLLGETDSQPFRPQPKRRQPSP